MPYVNQYASPYQQPAVAPQMGYPAQYLTAGSGMAAYGQQQQQQQPVHGFTYVAGMDGARAFWLPNGSEMPLFDNLEDGVMYIKKVDQGGKMSVERGHWVTDEEYARLYPQELPQSPDYATQDDIRAMHAEIDDLRKAIGELQPRQTVHARKEA